MAKSTVRRRGGKHGKSSISKKSQASQLYANCAWKAHRTSPLLEARADCELLGQQAHPATSRGLAYSMTLTEPVPLTVDFTHVRVNENTELAFHPLSL